MISYQDLAERVEMDYQETSAKEDVNVSGVFLSLVRQMISSGQAGKDSSSLGGIQITSTHSKRPQQKASACCPKS